MKGDQRRFGLKVGDDNKLNKKSTLLRRPVIRLPPLNGSTTRRDDLTNSLNFEAMG